MKIQFDTEEELIAFNKAASLPWGERVSPVAMIEFAITELHEFEFMRSDLLSRLEVQTNQLKDILATMRGNLTKYELDQKQITLEKTNATQDQTVSQ